MTENFPAQAYMSKQSGVIFIKLLGEFRFRDSALLQKCLDAVEAELDLLGLIIDLRETHSVDSTILGVLAQIGFAATKLEPQKPVMIAHPDDIYKILTAMSFDKIFDLVTKIAEKTTDFEKVKPSFESDHDLVLRVLQAHKTLSHLSHENAAQFREVIDLIEENLKKIS